MTCQRVHRGRSNNLSRHSHLTRRRDLYYLANHCSAGTTMGIQLQSNILVPTLTYTRNWTISVCCCACWRCIVLSSDVSVTSFVSGGRVWQSLVLSVGSIFSGNRRAGGWRRPLTMKRGCSRQSKSLVSWRTVDICV